MFTTTTWLLVGTWRPTGNWMITVNPSYRDGGAWRTTLVRMIVAGSVRSVLEEEKQATMLSAKVGEYVVFDCPLDFPHDYVIPYILRWNKEVSAHVLLFSGIMGWSRSSFYRDRKSVSNLLFRRYFKSEWIYYFTYFSTVVPSNSSVFLSCVGWDDGGKIGKIIN